MVLNKQLAFGDRVIHLERPEWGVGQVSSAVPDSHEGKTCQRITVRFERAGIKTLNTALAKLIPAEDAPAILSESPPNGDPLMGGGAPSAREVMLRLPEAATDPFTTPRARLAATLKLYRYSDQGGSLIDWAAAQSGLKDPMTRFSRHELEDLFRRFMAVRDEHLKKVILEVKREDPAGLLAEAREAPRAAHAMLRRFDALR